MKKNKNIVYRILGVILILVVVNWIANSYFVRWDFTSDQRYTLSKATKKILREVKQPIIITLYISEDLPPDVDLMIKDFRKLLVEYNNLSKRRIDFELIHPNKNEELEQEAIEAGIRPIPLEVREKDQVKVQKVYLGAMIQVGDKSEVIPLIKPGIAMEYSLSLLIKKLTIKKKPLVGYVQGHGEPPVEAMSQAYQELSRLYDIKSVKLSDSSSLDGYKSVVIVAPMDTITGQETDLLDDYLAKGGSIFVALDRVTGYLRQGIGVEVNSGLERWLENKGLFVDASFIVDKKCGTVTVHQTQGFFSYNQQLNFPYLPVITNFANHSITDGLESMVLQFASPITYVGDSAVNYRPLAWSSKISGKFAAPVSFNIGRQWHSFDFLYPEQTVAALLEGPLVSETPSKLFLVGDGNFMVNGVGEGTIQIQPDNINFMVNAIDWLTDDSGLLALRTKGISSRPINEMDEGRKLWIKYFNLFIPGILVIIYGLIRFERRRVRRGRQRRPGYIK